MDVDQKLVFAPRICKKRMRIVSGEGRKRGSQWLQLHGIGIIESNEM